MARSSAPVAAFVAAIDDVALWLAFLVAAAATAGSLYFSELAHFIPCTLCWYQRIAMYPLSLILLIAAIRRDRGVRWYVGPLAGAGAVISTYHYLVEWYPSLEGPTCARCRVPCTDVVVPRARLRDAVVHGAVRVPVSSSCWSSPDGRPSPAPEAS